jgi:mRNA-degrading endonuclease RelE of RelBE toxin-antitoxin system
MKIINTPIFSRQLKRLAKRHRSIIADVVELATTLLKNPQEGESIGSSCYKIRLAISSKGKGKSGGARVITCVRIEGETIHLLTIYDKADREDLEDDELEDLLKQIS